ncbi:MAG TPA: hypothetical protein RMH99_10845 [Sandaracinaceae bacterium LLY-WYZ-13_1]|nr:hypothetical protein [Sandaracinaceae bacterium LLY-WYZ-13_1]
MTTERRDSFEAIDLRDVEVLDESGPRRLPGAPVPRGLWSDVAPRPEAGEDDAHLDPASPAPALVPSSDDWLAGAPDEDPEAVERLRPLDEDEAPAEPERFELDGLVEDLSTRPGRISQSGWEIPRGIGADPGAAEPEPHPTEEELERTRPVWALASVAVVAYTFGVLTPLLLGWTEVGPVALSDDAPIEAGPSAPSVVAGERADEAAAGPIDDAEPRADEGRVDGVGTDERAGAPSGALARAAGADPDAPVGSGDPASGDSASGAASDEVVTIPPTRVRTPAARSAARGARDDASRGSEPPASRRPSRPPAPAPSADLPPTPRRSDVEAAMASIRRDVAACGDAQTQGYVARVRFTFASSGRVRHAVAQGVRGPAASCIARAARGAELRPFARDRFVVEYPFQL